ncbi:MAG: TonB family protein [Candidatus Korobacteraceae bacterium]
MNAIPQFRRPLDEGSISPPRELRFAIPWSEPFPWRGVTDSVFAHAALLALLYAFSIWPQAGVHLDESRSYHALHAYPLSQYLPELHGAPTHRRQEGKADPLPARQPIQLLPDAPDNLQQTIVTPRGPTLRRDVELPNLVAFQPPLSAQPLQAIARSTALQLTGLQPGLPARAPEIVQLKPRRALPAVRPGESQPAPEPASIRQASPPGLAQLLPPAANPALPVQLIVQNKPQRAAPKVPSGGTQPAPEAGSIGNAGAPNLTQLLPPSGTHMPQLLALNAHPADVPPPASLPAGNRSGAFAASPNGRANATGAPGAGDSPGSGKNDAGAKVNAPAGITVGAPLSAAAATALSDGPSAKPETADSESRTKLLATLRPPATASIPARPPVARENPSKPTDLENHIFAGRRSYALAVNMPNLNSASGSWIIHFVDRNQGLVPTPIIAPEVVRKSDPAYPIDLIRDGVKGTVILTAIIRADGSVGEIAVAQGVDPQLDQNAVEALSRWLFRPALKNGQAIDLQAVFMVPFRPKAPGF